MTTVFTGSGCELRGFGTTCGFFQQMQRELSEAWGVEMPLKQVKFLTVHPGTWIRPHTADNNLLLKIHLGLAVPPDVSISSCNETLVWKEGKAIYFDDSLRHSVAHRGSPGAAPRTVLDVKFRPPEPARIDFPKAEAGSGGYPIGTLTGIELSSPRRRACEIVAMMIA